MTKDPVFPLLFTVFRTNYWNNYIVASEARYNRKVSL